MKSSMKLILLIGLLLFSQLAIANDDCWVVTWDVIETFMVPCPRPGPREDEFGRVAQSNSMTLQMCWDSKTASYVRAFSDEKDAREFYNRGCKGANVKDLDGGNTTTLSNFKIRKGTE